MSRFGSSYLPTPSATIADLLKPENKATLAGILTYPSVDFSLKTSDVFQFLLNRRMRTRMYGGMGRVPGNGHPYPISALIRRAGMISQVFA